tara:strand:- start:271 stop:513 length:243 start_codon:yes stop_codon:yes gene_type:complete
MFNPLVDSMDQLTDAEVENKVTELSRKYFQTKNLQLQQQLSTVIDMYKEEAKARRAKALIKQQNNSQDDNNSLDNLINIS